MRIGFDAKRLFNNFTGLGNHSRTTIDILTAHYPEHECYLYTPSVRLNDATERYLRHAGCRTVQPRGVVGGSLWRTFALPGELRRDGVELFHGLSNELPVGIRRSGVPSVVTIHDVAFRTFTDMYAPIDRAIYDMKWRYACSHADRIIAISQCTKRDVMRFYNVPEEKIDVVYQPVAPIYYHFENLEKFDIIENIDNLDIVDNVERSGITRPYMLYVGSVNSRKNLLGVAKAMRLMPPDLQLPLVVVGGGGAYRRTVERYVAENGLQQRFVWTECIDHRQLRRLYAGAELFVYPSFYEGFGLPVVEAMLSGCPVVTSNVSSLPEAGGPYALKADPADEGDIARQMTSALTDSTLRAEMSVEGRKWAFRTFHPQVLAGQLMDVYNKVV